MNKRDEFHKHLESCKMCMDHPFDMCIVGQRLILQAVRELPGMLTIEQAVDYLRPPQTLN